MRPVARHPIPPSRRGDPPAAERRGGWRRRGLTQVQTIVLCAAGAIVVFVCILASVFSGAGDADSTDPEQRIEAARHLAGESDAESLATLHRLAGDSDLRVARAAVRAMAQAGKPANAQAVQRILSENPNPVVRGEAAAALGSFETVPVRRLTSLLAAAGKDNAAVRAGAARGLARRRDRHAVPALVKCLSDPDPSVRAWAITAISKTTCQRYDYDARKPPSSQQDKIAQIKRKLAERLPR